MNQLPELLAPAGDFESLRAAIDYGADAVYLGAAQFGMRASAAKFGGENLRRAVQLAHEKNVRVYLTCNTFARNAEVRELPAFLSHARDCGVDALIVADLGIMMEARRLVPEIELHVSTQAGVVNYQTACHLYQLGASRVVLARELSLAEIAEIRRNTPPELELECFVHGAMCMSVSGRCLLSHYLTGRDANRGECAQPCRWGYHLVEEKRPGQYFPIYEEDGVSYILNARDLCMIEHLDKLAQAGVSSFKIEGRAKSAYYTASVTAAYRAALEQYRSEPQRYRPQQWVLDEVHKVSHRPYSTGFYFSTPEQVLESGGYQRAWEVAAAVDGWEDGWLICTQRNKFLLGDTLEVLQPHKPPVSLNVERMLSETGEEIAMANHAMMRVKIACDTPFAPGCMLRKPRGGVPE